MEEGGEILDFIPYEGPIIELAVPPDLLRIPNNQILQDPINLLSLS